jgi:hypothetical protein
MSLKYLFSRRFLVANDFCRKFSTPLISYKTSNFGRDFSTVSDRAEVATEQIAQIGGN